MRQQHKQSGFVGIIVTLVVAVAVLALVGFTIYQNQKTKPIANSSSTSSSQTLSQKETTTVQTGQTVTQYLVVKEWGVEFPLADNIKDAYYVIPKGITPDADGLPSGVIVGQTSLNGSCGVVSTGNPGYSNSVGEIVRVLPTDKDPVQQKLYTQIYPNGSTIGGYYYGYFSTIKNKTCASSSSLQSSSSSFATAVKGAVTVTAASN